MLMLTIAIYLGGMFVAGMDIERMMPTACEQMRDNINATPVVDDLKVTADCQNRP